MDNKLIELLVCPLCKGKLDYRRSDNELICQTDRLAYPIKDGVPVMLHEQARPLSDDEL